MVELLVTIPQVLLWVTFMAQLLNLWIKSKVGL